MDKIVQELQLLYQPPKAVQEAGDLRAYLTAWCETILDESHDADELVKGWAEFKRTYEKPFWPPPGQVCQVIRSMRAQRQQYEIEAHNYPKLPETDYHKPEMVSEATRNATLKALADAEIMSRSDDPKMAALGKQLVSLGLTIIARNGPPSANWRDGE